MKATCPNCDTEISYKEKVDPFRCYNCGTEIPKEEITETEDSVNDGIPEENKEWGAAEHAEIHKEAIEDGEIEE